VVALRDPHHATTGIRFAAATKNDDVSYVGAIALGVQVG
jgi:hypothetical protein